MCISCQDEMLEQNDISVTRTANTTSSELDGLIKVTIDIWSAYENTGTDEIILEFTSNGVITQKDMNVIVLVRGEGLVAIASD